MNTYQKLQFDNNQETLKQLYLPDTIKNNFVLAFAKYMNALNDVSRNEDEHVNTMLDNAGLDDIRRDILFIMQRLQRFENTQCAVRIDAKGSFFVGDKAS
jgi:hypothetical protein